jgi:vancomycin resistance protein YoaR
MAGFGLILVVAAALGLTAIAPRYQVFMGDRRVAAGRDLAALGAALQADAAQAVTRKVTLTARGTEWTFTLADLGMAGRTAPWTQLLRDAERRLPWWQRLVWSRPVIRLDGAGADWDTARLTVALAPVRAAVEHDGTDATFAIQGTEPVITPEVAGTAIDVEALLAGLRDLGDHTSLEVPTRPKPPAVTAAALAAMRIKRLVAEWTTEYDPSIPRAENVERAARAFDGKLIKPGEILSYNATVGPVDAASGWRQAFVIVDGQLVPGVGGGVCQTATTLYGAALRAGLEIAERHQHQLAVAYIAPSQDAAIAQGYEDLKIRNSTEGYIYIQTEAGGGKVTFRLYGDVPENQRVQIESRVLGALPFATRTVTDPSLGPGRQETQVAGHAGLSSEAYRLIYLGDTLVKRELLSRDSYLPTAAVVAVGPAPKPAPQPDPPPNPQPYPQPNPQPDPQPNPQPDPQPNPQPDPQPAPQPDPQPAPQPDPQPAPQPAPPPPADGGA